MQTIAVVGASLAGLRGAEALRRHGFAGRLVLVGAEPHRPYDRPPLSKEVLRGQREAEQIALAKPEAFAALELDLRLPARARTLDAAARTLTLEGGERICFDGCLIATGARPRRLRGTPEIDGIHVLRSLDDSLALRAELERGPRVAVVGAGFIGAEVAASCRQRGLAVTLIDVLPLPLANALGPEVGRVVAAVHADHGVTLRLGVPVSGFEGAGRVGRVRLADGSAVEADVVVVGIGVVPETDWLAGSGLAIDDGIVCDERCATSAPGVVAAGDVSRWRSRLFGRSLRIEHWTNAVEQANASARTLLEGAGAPPYDPVPFVWSDQYDRKLQAAGLPTPDCEVRVLHESPEERRFLNLYGSKGRLVGAVAMNRVRPLMAARRMIQEGLGFEDAVARAEAL
jgi:3-phenylpropionate/trans-cinnamate dioxygenase ferredoxin reductase subunit